MGANLYSNSELCKYNSEKTNNNIMSEYKEDVNNRFIEVCEKLLRDKIVSNKADIASMLGIKPNKLSEILGNRMRAGVTEIQNLCSIHNISYKYLFTGEGEMIKPTKEHTSDINISEMGNSMLIEVINNQNKLIERLEKENSELRSQLEIKEK